MEYLAKRSRWRDSVCEQLTAILFESHSIWVWQRWTRRGTRFGSMGRIERCNLAWKHDGDKPTLDESNLFVATDDQPARDWKKSVRRNDASSV